MFPFTKILEVPVTLHKKIKDNDIVVCPYVYDNTHIFILDRNDIINNQLVDINLSYIEFNKIISTVVREQCFFGGYSTYRYLHGITGSDNVLEENDYKNFPLFINENIRVIQKANIHFSQNAYLKNRGFIRLEKNEEPYDSKHVKYTICYYYSNKDLDIFFNTRRKDKVLIYLLEKSEKQHILAKSNQLLHNVLEFPIKWNNTSSIDNLIDSSIIFNSNIELFNYQKNDILWFKHIEKTVLEKNNRIYYNTNYYYPILNDNYLMSSNGKDIIPNINKGTNENETHVNTMNAVNSLFNFITTKSFHYFGGNIISDLGLGKTLILLYAILHDIELNNSTLYNSSFIEFSKHCNYFYKLGPKKGKCCTKEINNTSSNNNGIHLFCTEHKDSLFIDKRHYTFKNMEFFNIKNYITSNNLLQTKSTLILCPSHLCNQWINEYYSKCNNNIINKRQVLLISTYSQYINLTISDVLFSDIVILSYSFLTNQKYMNIIKKFDYNKKFDEHVELLNNNEFPLNIFHWNRVVFEEFHEIRNLPNSYQIKKSSKSFISNFKWNISGTPFANGINGFIDSLEFNTNISLPTNDSIYSSNHNTNTLIETSDLHDIHMTGLNNSCNLIHNTLFLFKRNTKESVQNEYTSSIIRNHTKLLEFTEEERSIYDSHFVGFNNKYSKFLIQLCCHPELYAETKHLLKNCKTLSEIRHTLLNHNKKNLHFYKQKIESTETQITALENTLQNLPPLNSDTQTEQIEELTFKLSVLRRNLTNDKKMYININKTYIYLENTIKNIETQSCETSSCPICLEDIELSKMALTSCGHKFCWECIENYTKVSYNKNCPCCKTILGSNDVYLLKTTSINPNSITNELSTIVNDIKSTKIGNLVYWIKQELNKQNEDSSSINSKIIIFSQWDEILNKVHDYLIKYNINVLQCKGSVYQKNKCIEMFKNNNNYNIIMLSSRNAASGINLTIANKIVFIEPVYGTHEYRTDIENQAIGRCARIGNSLPIDVTRFIIDNTIESDILNNTIDDTKIKII